DVGSNAMRMVIGEVDQSWQVKTIENIRLPVRLGQDVFSKGYLEEKTIRQTEEAFLRFKHMAKSFDIQHLRAVATSAAREAENSDILLDRVFRSSGIELEIISGEEEARLIHLAVVHELKLKEKRTLLIDIGGGSVEVTISTGQNIISTDSYGMGTVRLLERLDSNGKSGSVFGKLVREYAESARHRIERDLGDQKIQICAATGGNVEEIGRLRQKLFKAESDRCVTLEELGKLIERLDQMSYEERMQKLKLRADRADVILPASIVLHLIAREAGVQHIAIPNVGLKDGILLEMAGNLSKSLHARRSEQVWESALHMGRKYQFDEKHARLTSKLAARLFDQSKPLHNLDDGNLLLLEVGALLHDIGHFINTLDHDKHGHYLLSVNRLVGLSQREQNVVANLVRYHRRQSPSSEDENFKSLPQKDRLIVIKLAALLRLADSLDISHMENVTDVTLKETKSGWRMKISGRKDQMLVNWAFNKRKSHFREVFGVSLEMDG
ncbi:MAG TPA: Ppx/GppA phosphatase family protein, partial [Anaerolineales bacterium]|nr:Ppx/GppA phosphatase family protein [Anaerolineales bacterium]